MIKVFALDPRRPDLTEEQFHAHWRGPHAELALRIRSQRRYVQNHRLPVKVPGLAPCIYDGMAEVWFDDFAAADGLLTDPDYTEYSFLDEPNFIDMTRIRFFSTGERVVLEGPPIAREADLVKVLLLLSRLPGLSPGAFDERWLPHGASAVAAMPGLLRHVQCPTSPESYAKGEPAFDGVSELWWPDTDTFRRDWAAASSALLEGMAAFAVVPEVTGFLAEEYRVIWP